MRLVKQTKLQFQAGRSDKVYEVDLCEVGPEQFVVNFRYGRRNAALHDGTKTVLPVPQAKAQQLFDDLVAAKTGKGYQVTFSGAPGRAVMVAQTDPAPSVIDPNSAVDPRAQAILARLRAKRDDKDWPLDRVIWRAGVLGIVESLESLVLLSRERNSMRAYACAWATGRIGPKVSRADPRVASCAEALDRLAGDKQSSEAVRRMATAALLCLHDAHNDQAAEALRERIALMLPEELRPLASDDTGPGSFRAAEQTFRQLVERQEESAADSLWTLYLGSSLRVRPLLLWALGELPVRGVFFAALRRIFKLAELRNDGEAFGVVLRRLETCRAQSAGGFKPAARMYLRRSAWRTLRRYGALGDNNYVELSTGVLLAMRDTDGNEPRAVTRYAWATREHTTLYTLDRFALFLAFNSILFGRSRRYVRRANRKLFTLRPEFKAGDPPPAEREESYPELWERNPKNLEQLLLECRCLPVHEFAGKALRACPGHLLAVSIATVAAFLSSPYEITAKLGWELAQSRYDPTRPDATLFTATANSTYEPARVAAYDWLQRARAQMQQDAGVIAGLITSPREQTRTFARSFVQGMVLREETASEVVARLVAELISPDNTDEVWSGDVVHTALICVGRALAGGSAQVIDDLAAHPLASVQVFAGKIIAIHPQFALNPPLGVMQHMIDSEHESVRRMGMELLAKLSDALLIERAAAIGAMLAHRHAELRAMARPIAKRLAALSAEFAGTMVLYAVEQLIRPKTSDEVRRDMAELLRNELSTYLDRIPEADTWRLLRAHNTAAHDIGGLLLKRRPPAGIAMTELLELANHEVLSVRQAAWQMLKADKERVKAEAPQAVRMLDANWEDSRNFAAGFFQETFSDSDYTPEVLLSICDSNREQVQRFGRDLLTRHFTQEAGAEYLTKLSEHPSASMQAFVSGLVAAHASGNSERLAQLVPFFASVLGRVNQGRVAKERTLSFLADEAQKDPKAAELIAALLTPLSATMAITYKARAVEILASIHRRYPEVSLPLTIRAPEARRAV